MIIILLLSPPLFIELMSKEVKDQAGGTHEKLGGSQEDVEMEINKGKVNYHSLIIIIFM